MAHRIYHSSAFVLGSQSSGETGRSFWFFTDNLGLVIADARAVREIKSKLRYHLTTGSLATISLVKGRDRWRLVGAETDRVLPNGDRRSWVSILELVRSTFVAGQPEPRIFSELESAFSWIYRRAGGKVPLADFRIVTMFRILGLLGLVDGGAVPILSEWKWDQDTDLKKILKTDLRGALREIRRALAVV